MNKYVLLKTIQHQKTYAFYRIDSICKEIILLIYGFCLIRNRPLISDTFDKYIPRAGLTVQMYT